MTSNAYDQLAGALPPLEVPKRALTVGAHPDDAEFGAGATLARWADHGCEIAMVIVTDGSKGSWDPDEDQADLVNRRQNEQRAAAAVIGAGEIFFLDNTDGELEYSSALRAEIAELIRRARPEVVLTHDPWQRYQMHPDHRAVGMATVDGVVSAREPLAPSASGLSHHRPDALLLWSADAPDHQEPASDEYFDRKIEALLHHSSQAGTTMGDATASDDHLAEFAARLRTWMAVDVPSGSLAERFKRLTP